MPASERRRLVIQVRVVGVSLNAELPLGVRNALFARCVRRVEGESGEPAVGEARAAVNTRSVTPARRYMDGNAVPQLGKQAKRFLNWDLDARGPRSKADNDSCDFIVRCSSRPSRPRSVWRTPSSPPRWDGYRRT